MSLIRVRRPGIGVPYQPFRPARHPGESVAPNLLSSIRLGEFAPGVFSTWVWKDINWPVIATGQAGRAYDFDGVNNYLTEKYDAHTKFVRGDVSYTFYAVIDGGFVSNLLFFSTWADTNGARSGLRVKSDGSHIPGFLIRDPSAAAETADGTTALVAGETYVLVGRKRAGQPPEFFLNGVLEGTAASNIVTDTNTNTFTLAGYQVLTSSDPTAFDLGNGLLYAWGAADRAWSDDEIAVLADDPFAPFRRVEDVWIPPGSTAPQIGSVTSPVQPGDTLTITGTNLDLVTSTTFAGSAVTMTSQTATQIQFTVPDAYTNGLWFKSQTVQVSDGSNTDSASTVLDPPAAVDYHGEVLGYDSLPSDQESIFDDSTISVVDGDKYIVEDPSALITTLYDDGTYDADTVGDVYVRVLDTSDTTDGPDGTWTTERTYTTQTSTAIGLAAENDSALAVDALKAVQVSQVAESDSALGVTATKVAQVGIATESEQAPSVTAAKSQTIGQPIEVSTAFALTVAKTAQIGQTQESDTALPIGNSISRAIGLVAETDAAPAVTASKTKVIGPVVETSTAFGLSAAKSAQIGLATESDTALTLGSSINRAIGLATETDTATSVSATKAVELGVATEAETAWSVTTLKAAIIGLVQETDQALLLGENPDYLTGSITIRPVLAGTVTISP